MGRDSAGGLSSTDTAAPGGESTVTPSAILSQLNVANTAEIQLGTLVAKQASSRQVQELARKLAADHAKNRQELRALAQKLNVSLIPSQGGEVKAGTGFPPDLQGKTGPDFDQAFVQHEIEDHEANIEKIRNQLLPAVQDQQIRAYLQQTVSDMEAHLAALQRVSQQVGGRAS
ncbi:MAG: DUF4142 domain-containing protein [Gemmatimonadales bacterium]